jgi:hypothetical protein
MVAYAPPGAPVYYGPAKEKPIDTQVRYESIANDIIEVFRTEKPLFGGPSGKLRSMVLVMSIMKFEGNFRRDVDFGKGPYARGDQGNSACLMQLNIGKSRTTTWNVVQDRPAYPTDPKEEIAVGWTAKELFADRTKCIRAGVRLLRHSILTCSAKGLPQKDWLRAYVSGTCAWGSTQSSNRMSLAIWWYKAHTPSFDDSSLEQSIYRQPVWASYTIK